MISALPLSLFLVSQPAAVTRLAAGSCYKQGEPAPAWATINRYNPDAFLFLGDNMYFDTNESSGDFDKEYARMLEDAEFKKLYATKPIFATWDDHDYGLNDSGVEYPRKEEAQKAFNKFWKVPASSGRHSRGGIYDSTMLGPEGQRVQIIILDTRFFRSSLTRQTEAPRGYLPDTDPAKTMLGDAQWQWLRQELKRPAEVRLIMSSIQVISEQHRFEKWANLPLERQKLFDTIKETEANGVIFLSGDRHLAELSMLDAGVGYPLYDLTASAINRSSRDWRMVEENRWRVGGLNTGQNFGAIEFDWKQEDPLIRLQIRDEGGDIMVQQKIRLSWLKAGKIKPRTP